MLITPWFSFLHMAKTGGSFVKEVLVAQYGDQVTAGFHDPWDRLPERELPVLMFVRNPWDWYVSWYHYLQDLYARQPPETRNADPVFRSVFGSGRHDFATAVRLACDGEVEVPMPAFQDLIARHRDFYTAAFRYMTGEGLDDPRLTIGCMERLRQDLVAFVERTDAPERESLVRAIRETPPHNESVRGDYRGYYDAQLRSHVGRTSHWITERYGYTFD